MGGASLAEAQKLQKNNAIFGDGLVRLRSGNRADKGTLCFGRQGVGV